MKVLDRLPTYLDKAVATEGEAFDLRFEKVVTFIEQERYMEAVPIIEKILDEGCLDIRLVMYLLFAEFLNSGFSALLGILDQILILLAENKERISPLKMKEKHIQNSLTWFFSTLGKKLRRSQRLFKENKPDPFWNESILTLTPDLLEDIKKKISELEKYFQNVWGDHQVLQHLLFLKKWATDFTLLVEKPSHTPPPIESNEEDLEVFPENKKSSEPSLPPAQEKSLSPSPLMQSLCKKLEAFEHLIEKKDFTKAALIAKDLKALIETFNPTLYFPSLFTQYLSLTAKHISTLSEEWESVDSLTWNSLEQLYHADLDAFIHW